MPQVVKLHPLVVLLLAAILPSGVPAAEPPLHELIDQAIESRLTELKVPPAEIADDTEFLRRISLDLTGTIPTAAVARAFLADSDPEKRTKLIDELLASDAFAARMATVFDVMLMERRPDKHVTTPEWRAWLAASFAENKPLDQLAAEILGADGVDEKLRPAAKFYLDRDVDRDVLVQDIARLFLGVNLQCAQCHDHPDISDYLHRHYYGLAVFVSGSKPFRQPDGTTVLQENVLREVEYASVFEPDKTHTTGPRLIEALLEVPEFEKGDEYVETPSRTVRAVPKFSLRQLLAERLPTSQTPEFSRNLANRLWALILGRGLVHPLDMHHSANPPSHPALLELLTSRLAESEFDCRGFLRELALSRTYQRSSLLPENAAAADIPEDSFAVAPLKALSPEQLFDNLLIATRAEPVLLRSIDQALAADSTPAGDAGPDDKPEASPEEAAAKLAEARQAKRAETVAEFVTIFGSAAAQPEGEFSASLPQALYLANSEVVLSWVAPEKDNLTGQLATFTEADQLADELYLSVFNRLPADEERQWVAEVLQQHRQNRSQGVATLVWSLIASAEFRLNH
ncbi:MAG: DUF1549 domain-containing protein [Planctomycetaceae bacterium]|nr:DUF1549 domain-containing protein [Planctomycetaceae bacterium]